MTDIVKRIWDKCLGNNNYYATMAKEAAEEITKLRELTGDKAECLCEGCNVIHPLQRNGIFQPCPDCGAAMFPTSYNLRLIKKLREEVERLHMAIADHVTVRGEYFQQLATAQLENRELREALSKFGLHKLSCDYVENHRGGRFEGSDGECDCGFEKALSKTYGDSALRSYVVNEVQRLDDLGYIAVGFCKEFSDRYERGEV